MAAPPIRRLALLVSVLAVVIAGMGSVTPASALVANGLTYTQPGGAGTAVTVMMTCRLNAAARAARTRKALRLRLTATFTGTSGGLQTSFRVVTLPRIPVRPAVAG